MMNKTQVNYIFENLNSLIENTKNIGRLFIYMDAFDLLSLAERQVLMSFPDDSSRLREMYTVLTQKDVDNYYHIIKCLQLSENINAANVLEQYYQNVMNGIGRITPNRMRMSLFIGDEFQVLHRHVAVIVEILEAVQISQFDWDNIIIDLIERNHSDLVNLPTPSSAFKMMMTLDAWVEIMKKNATFSLLFSTISKTHKGAAEALLTNKDEILLAE